MSEPINWDSDRTYYNGLDRGVLYPDGGDGVAWNGLRSFDEGGSGSSTIYYRDGVVFYADADASDFVGKLTTIYFPDEFATCIGMPEVTDGLIVDNQKPTRFSFCYRTLVGSGERGDMFGYQLHLVYNAFATIAPRSRKSLGADPEITEFTFDLVCTPVKLAGWRPSAHYVLDTRSIGASTLATLEGILYGTLEDAARMPTPSEMYDLMNFGDTITFVDHGDGTWTASGSEANVHMISPDNWEILNVNGVDHGDGTFTLSDTP